MISDEGMNLETKLMFQRIIGNELVFVDVFQRDIKAMQIKTTALIVTLTIGFFAFGILFILSHGRYGLIFAGYMYWGLYFMSRQWERQKEHLTEQEQMKDKFINLYTEISDSIDNHEGE